jgi:hypothetical protein
MLTEVTLAMTPEVRSNVTMAVAEDDRVAGVMTNALTGEAVAPPKYADSSYVVLTDALVDQVIVAWYIVSDAKNPVLATEFRQTQKLPPLTRLPGEMDELESSAVHLVALDGDVRLARLAPALVNETPVGGFGPYVAPPSL